MQFRTHATSHWLDQPTSSGRGHACGYQVSCRRAVFRISAKGRRADQKNDGVYFEYVENNAQAPWISEDKGQFDWVRNARESAKTLRSTKESTSASRGPTADTKRKQRKGVKTAATRSAQGFADWRAPKSSHKNQHQPAAVSPANSATATERETPATYLDLDALKASLRSLRLPDDVLAKAVADAESRQSYTDEEPDKADGDLYDDDDEMDIKLRQVDLRTDLSAKDKARLKMQLLGFYSDDDDEDEEEDDKEFGSEPELHGRKSARSNAANTTTGVAPGDAPVLAARPMLKGSRPI